jgi:hypothetical protein
MVLGKECPRSPATGLPVSPGAGWTQARPDEGRWLDRSICECAQATECHPPSLFGNGHLMDICARSLIWVRWQSRSRLEPGVLRLRTEVVG